MVWCSGNESAKEAVIAENPTPSWAQARLPVSNWIVLFLSSITVAEIEDEIAKARRAGARRKAARLAGWLEAVLHLYASRILPFDVAAARVDGTLSDRARSKGQSPGIFRPGYRRHSGCRRSDSVNRQSTPFHAIVCPGA